MIDIIMMAVATKKNKNKTVAVAVMETVTVKSRLKGFYICFHMCSTKLLNGMSGGFEQVVQHC